MDNEDNSLIGTEWHRIIPEFIFGDLLFTGRRFKIIKVHKVSATVENLDEIGCSFDTKVKLSKLGSYSLDDFEEIKKFNIKFIQNTLTKYNKELEGYTKKHPKYQEKVDEIYILNKMLDCSNYLSYDNVRQCNKDIMNYLNSRLIYKVGQKVKYGNSIGVIESRKASLKEVKGFCPKHSYAVKFKDSFHSSIAEKDLLSHIQEKESGKE